MALEIAIPGFRFHPTDEELVGHYLRRKVCSKRFCVDMISDADVYKVEPWDLPDLSSLKTRDLEWYFFSVLDKKYGNGCRTNRATEKGYWKTTGKDRTVYNGSQMVGMKKTLVYHIGRAPKSKRTDWVMHEYRLVDQELEKAGIVQDVFVLCRVVKNPATESNQDEEEQLGSQNDSSSGDELHVTHIENSTSSEKIFQENILLPVPEALEQGMKAMVENRIAPLETKYKTAPILLSQEAIEDQYGTTMKEAAKTLNVSISTLKRKCRAFGISEWQGPSPAKRKVNDLYSNQSDTNEEDTGTIQEPLPINRNEHTLTIKAEYAGDVIKFRLHIFQATFETVMEEIGTRLKLTPGTYKVKYLDEDKDWILLTSEQDISDCIKSSRNSDQTAVRLHVEPST